MEKSNQYLYVIAAIGNEGGPVKLGISADPDRRVRQLQTGHVEPLKVYYREPVPEERAKLYERLLHRDNFHLRQRGEWFNMSVANAALMVQFTLIQYDLETDQNLKKQFR